MAVNKFQNEFQNEKEQLCKGIIPRRGNFLYGLAILVVLAIIISFSYGIFDVSSVNNLRNRHYHPLEPIPEAKSKSSVEGAAYVLLALGVQANTMNCPAAIESLVRKGGWGGEVYMITDRADCFDEEEIVSNAGMDEDKFHLISTEESFSYGGFDLMHSKIGARKNRVKSFMMKTKLFDYIPEHIHTLAYVDCDILFAYETCPVDFLTTGPPWTDAAIRVSRVKRDEATNNMLDIHAGSFVVHREHSQPMLTAWKEQIQKYVDEGDNDAFMEVFNRFNKRNTSFIVKTYDSSTLAAASGRGTKAVKSIKKSYEIHGDSANNPMTVYEMRCDAEKYYGSTHFEHFVNRSDSVLCLNHVSKSRCTSIGRDNVQRLVDRFELRTYKHGEQYCMSPYIQPLLYGWFPTKLLPGCPKFERWL